MSAFDKIYRSALPMKFFSKGWGKPETLLRGSSLNYVADLFVMGGALIMECDELLKWCESNGFGPLALHGISMGGYGIMATAVDWSTLTKQYYADSVYSKQIRPLLQPSVPDFCRCDTEPSNHLNPEITLSARSSPTQPDPLSQRPNFENLVPDSSGSSIPIHTNNPSSSSSESEKPASEVSKMLYFLKLASLKQWQWDGSWSNWTIPQAFRQPFDASLWHSGISMLRSWPDSLGTNSNPPDPEVSQFLRELLDHFTHLGNYSPPVDSRLMLSVTAEQDAYVPRQGVIPLNKLYAGSEIRYLSQSGHVGAYLRNAVWTTDFRQAITDCLNRQVELHHGGGPGPFGIPHSKSTSTITTPPTSTSSAFSKHFAKRKL